MLGCNVYAVSQNQTNAELTTIKDLKIQLYNDLNGGDIKNSAFDDKTELDIAKTQMAIANYYLTQGDRKNAAISAIIARKIYQRIYSNPNDPLLIPIYSLLVQIYASSVDIDEPGKDVSDAEKARQYRELIDHIHAE